MDFSLTIESSPFWLAPIVIFAGAMTYWQYSSILHFHNFSQTKLWTLRILRFICYLTVSVLLLSPFVKFSHQRIEKPILIWGQDNSNSLLLNGDSAYIKDLYQKEIRAFQKRMSDKFEVESFGFGSRVIATDRFDFKDRFTNYSEFFTWLKLNFATRNVGALVLASDGLFNKGNNPRYDFSKLSLPVYTLALGDTARVRDIALNDIRFNRIAFAKNRIPVQVFFSTHGFDGQNVELRVTFKKKILYRQIIPIAGEDFSKEIGFYIPSNQSGLHRYHIELLPLKGEFTVNNNHREIIVDVLDSRRKILLLYDTYHPDIVALRGAIDVNDNFEIEIIRSEQAVTSLVDYDLVILYQLPSIKKGTNAWLSEINRLKIPVLFIIGGQSDIKEINKLGFGLRIHQNENQYEEVQGQFNEQFSLFKFDEYERKKLLEFPPLLVPYGDFRTPVSADILFFQNIGSVETSLPLAFFSRHEEQKIAWILGEGLWRWKLYNFMVEQNHEIFNSLINNIVQYLSLQIRKDHLVVNAEKSYSEAANVTIKADFYNESYQRINDPEMILELTDSDKIQYRYSFLRTSKAYHIDLGNIPSGTYHYLVRVIRNNKEFKKEGNFIVTVEDIEAQGIKADHNLLYQLAELSGGKSFHITQLKDLETELRLNPSMLPKIYKEDFLDNLLKYSFFGILLIILITLEWFLRKFWGSY